MEKVKQCVLASKRKHLYPCYPLLYVIFMLLNCCKCSHICCSLYKMQMHHLLRECYPMAELSPLMIDSCSREKLTNWNLCFSKRTLWIWPCGERHPALTAKSVEDHVGSFRRQEGSVTQHDCVYVQKKKEKTIVCQEH